MTERQRRALLKQHPEVSSGPTSSRQRKHRSAVCTRPSRRSAPAVAWRQPWCRRARTSVVGVGSWRRGHARYPSRPISNGTTIPWCATSLLGAVRRWTIGSPSCAVLCASTTSVRARVTARRVGTAAALVLPADATRDLSVVPGDPAPPPPLVPAVALGGLDRAVRWSDPAARRGPRRHAAERRQSAGAGPLDQQQTGTPVTSRIWILGCWRMPSPITMSIRSATRRSCAVRCPSIGSSS